MNTTKDLFFKQDGDGRALRVKVTTSKSGGKESVHSVALVEKDVNLEFVVTADKAAWDAGVAHSTVICARQYTKPSGNTFLAEDVKFLDDDFPACSFQDMLDYLVFDTPVTSAKEGYYPAHKVYKVLLSRVGKTGSLRVSGASARGMFDGLTPTEVPRSAKSGKSLPPVRATKVPAMPTKKKAPTWLKPMPDAEEFYVERPVWEEVCYAINFGSNLLFTGPSGCGKSELIWRAASALGKTVEAFNMGAMSEPRTALIGAMHLTEKGTKFVESRFVPAVQSDKAVVLLDELTRTTKGASNLLLPLLDDQRYLSLDEAEAPRIIERHENNCICATANIGMEYTGTDALDKAMKDRFSSGLIELTFPPAEQEAVILQKRTGVDRRIAEGLARFAKHQRIATTEKEEYTEFVSTRMLLQASTQISRGVSPVTAAKYCILSHFSDDGGGSSERRTLAKLLNMNAKIGVPQ
jgi:MoxR-like ATPase